MRILLIIIFQLLSLEAMGTSVITKRCVLTLEKLTQNKDSLVERLKNEPDEEVKKYALIIHDDIRAHGAMTEMGAHGNGLSWKWLGVIDKGEGAEKKYKVVGYANFQNYMSPYAEMARRGEVFQIAVGSNLKNEVFIDGKQFGELPLATRQKIIKAIHLTLKPERVRVFQPEEQKELLRSGTLPQIGGSLSIVNGNDAGGAVSMLSIAPGRRSEANPAEINFMIDPTQPIIIGRQANGIPPYLDPNYQSTNIAPGRQSVNILKNDLSVSRAHFMLEAVVGKGIQVVNGVPSSEKKGEIRAPAFPTEIKFPGEKQWRKMEAKEVVLIPTRSWAIIRLPNGAEIRINAK